MAGGNAKFLRSISFFHLLCCSRRTLSTLHLPSRFLSLLQTPSLSRLSTSPAFFCTASAAHAEDVADALPSAAAHPWPEWEGFLEKLREKGYFDQASSAVAAAAGEGNSGSGGAGGTLDSSSYYNRVKVACLGFARERPDLLGSLPKEDIKVVVEWGCPNLLRKSVTSAKRLRAYLEINEANVCASCNLRHTCDRANVQWYLDEVRTVDVVRLLWQYATAESSVQTTDEGPRIAESVKDSVRKLLSELIELSDMKPDPDVLKVETKRPREDKPLHISKLKEANQLQNVDMKRGDWICTRCNFMNYARNLSCLRCKADGPKRVDFDSPEMKKGDWTCPQCQFMNFAKNRTCRRCQEPRPKQQLNPGEWECPSCNFVNFRRNKSCRKCNSDRPKAEEPSQYGDDEWMRYISPKYTT